MSLEEVTDRGMWRLVVQSVNRPYPVRLPMVVFLALVPLYVFIAAFVRERGIVYVPELALDRAIPLLPAWALVYGSLYGSLIVLPIVIVRQDDHIRRTVHAYLLVWITAYACFLWYPTAAPRPDAVSGGGFGAWSLRLLYGADPPFNCFPSIHVAHSFVSALALVRVHRRVGIAALVAAALVALSTLFTKQHYVLDVASGILLAVLAYVIFLRSAPREIPELDRRLAPIFAFGTIGLAAAGLIGFWIVYQLGASGM